MDCVIQVLLVGCLAAMRPASSSWPMIWVSADHYLPEAGLQGIAAILAKVSSTAHRTSSWLLTLLTCHGNTAATDSGHTLAAGRCTKS